VIMFNENTYINKKREFDSIWESSLKEELEKNGRVEREISIQKGYFLNGKPRTGVVLDGGFGTVCAGRYNDRTCVVLMYGMNTKKLLFLGIRNLDCSVCDGTPKR
jgi:hypothetical protein